MKRGARLVAMLLLGVTFVVGGLTGMALEESLGLDWFDFLDEDRLADRSALLGGIPLSDSQQALVDQILERREDRLEAYWESRLPEIESIVEQSYTEIRATLSPEQQSVFDQRVRELRGRPPAEVRD